MSMGSSLRDTLVAAGVVAALLGGLWLYTGVWPPMVVIESASMMHDDPTYGRLGTIDPGDLVLVKSVDDSDDVELWVENGRERYGAPGDVILFQPLNDEGRTPVIHRAITWVEVSGQGATRTYTFAWPGENSNCHDGTCRFGPEGVYMPELGFDTSHGFTPGDGWKPSASGFITKGDNPVTNTRADQATGISCARAGEAPAPRNDCEAVQPEWIEGVSRGELPWFGLVKLALGGRPNMADPPQDWVRIGWAFAPMDLWVMLGVSGGLLVLAPVVIDAWTSRREEA